MEMNFEDLKRLNEEGAFPKKFTDEELQKIYEIETSGSCSSGCPLYAFENPEQEEVKQNNKNTGLNSYSALIRKEAMNQDYCNIDDEGNFIYNKDDENIYYGDYGSLTTCGDEMQVWVKLSKDKKIVEDVKYLCSGCFGALSSASVGARLVIGKNIKDLNVKDIHDKTQEYLQLPSIKEHCSTYFINAVLKALKDGNAYINE